MREGWKEVELREITDVINGFAFKSKDFVESGIPLIKIKEIKENRINLSACSFLPSNFKLNEKFTVKKGDVIIALTGSHITLPSSAVGRVAMSYIDDVLFLNQRVGKFKVDENKADLNYLYFFLSSEYFFNSVGLMAKGAANQANISGDDIKSLKINLPPLETQRKIATILSGYDDLIENNLKRIKILEEMAQQTYEEWFVRMRFPGYETAVMNEETGLPEGWENGTLENITKYLSGFAFKSAQFKDNGNGVIRIKNIGNNTINLSDVAYVDNEYASKQKRYLLKSGDLLIAMTGATIGKVGIMPHSNERFYLNQRVGKFLTENTAFINCFFNSTYGINQILNIAGGAAQPNISAQQILNIELILPPKEILEKFAKPFNKQISIIINLQSQNQRLRETWDLLLPRLMMGIVEV